MIEDKKRNINSLTDILDKGWEIEEPVLFRAMNLTGCLLRLMTAMQEMEEQLLSDTIQGIDNMEMGAYHFILKKTTGENTKLLSLCYSSELQTFLAQNNLKINPI